MFWNCLKKVSLTGSFINETKISSEQVMKISFEICMRNFAVFSYIVKQSNSRVENFTHCDNFIPIMVSATLCQKLSGNSSFIALQKREIKWDETFGVIFKPTKERLIRENSYKNGWMLALPLSSAFSLSFFHWKILSNCTPTPCKST